MSTAGAAPSIRVVDVRKSFGPNEVLKGVSFDVARGSVVSMIGASGSGKSTLLRCINRLETPSAGDVLIDGESILWRDGGGPTGAAPTGAAPTGAAPTGSVSSATGAVAGRRPRSPAEVNRIRRELGMVFQQFNLWPHLTALENVIEAPRQVRGLPRREAVELGRACLERVQMLDKADAYPARLSGGQQQRVAIARALAMKPKALLFDEATSSLDPELTDEVLAVMRSLAADGTTMIVVTHEMGFAREVSDAVLFLHNGLIEEQGAPGPMFDAPRSERLAQFLARSRRRGTA